MKREYIKSKIKKIFKENKVEMLIAFLATLLSSFVAWRVYVLGLGTALTDQNAHLNFSRMVFDSMTPGISQIGFWPPLLHILMAPFTLSDFLYSTGLAGFVLLLPFLIMGAILLYKLSLLFTGNSKLSFVASLLFLLNPYVLYYTVTPMMEVLFISNVIAVAYFMALWFKTNRLWFLLLCGIFVSLASLSRFEGLILIPITSFIVFLYYIKNVKNYPKIEASMLLFIILAILGMLFLIIYSFIYGKGDPLTFIGGGWQRDNAVQRVSPGVIPSFLLILYSSFYLINKNLVLLSFVCFFPILILPKRSLRHLAVLFILLSPAVFVYFSVFKGTSPMMVPESNANYIFLNERYGLTWIGFVIMAPIFFVSILVKQSRSSIVLISAKIFMLSLLLLSSFNFYNVVFINNFDTIRFNVNIPSKDDEEVATLLSREFDGGKILITRSDNDPILYEANIPLKNYIYEGSYLFYGQALSRPWFFVRWVIMDKPEPKAINKVSEPISDKWADSQIFERYYILVAETDSLRFYKINEQALKTMANEQNLNLSKIPSINSELTEWNPETIYGEIGISKVADKNQEEALPNASAKKDLLELYNSEMKADYQKGFYLGKDNIGTSETQSYMLLQSYIADDQETFEKIWIWTKANIQRKEDHLFVWQFKSVNGITEIIDANPATDADEDIAFALIKAGEKWSKSEYIEEGKNIANDLWNIETAELNGKRYVTGGNWANTETNIVINPSYFSPFAYRLFAKYDIGHDWNKLTDDGYEFLDKASEANLNEGLKEYLPPNWISIDKKTEKLEKFNGNASSFDYSYDAFRVLWRVAVDYKVNNTDKAKAYLEKIKVFDEEWSKNGKVCSLYEMKSSVGECKTVITTMAGPLSVFYVTNPDVADRLIDKYYLQDGKIAFAKGMSFYDRSWYWFGLVLWSETEF